MPRARKPSGTAALFRSDVTWPATSTASESHLPLAFNCADHTSRLPSGRKTKLEGRSMTYAAKKLAVKQAANIHKGDYIKKSGAVQIKEIPQMKKTPVKMKDATIKPHKD